MAMQLRPCAARTALRLSKAAAYCTRATSAHVQRLGPSAADSLPQQVQQLGRQALFGSQSALLRSRVPSYLAGSRGLRTTPVTMGLRTGIVGLPNVGKVRRGSAWLLCPGTSVGGGLSQTRMRGERGWVPPARLVFARQRRRLRAPAGGRPTNSCSA